MSLGHVARQAATTAAAGLVGPLIADLVAWLTGEAPEPPALIHLGIPETELVDLRMQATAARALKAG